VRRASFTKLAWAERCNLRDEAYDREARRNWYALGRLPSVTTCAICEPAFLVEILEALAKVREETFER
jgi:hypothetical protein